MIRYALGILIFVTAVLAGCAQAPARPDQVDNVFPEGPGAIEEHLSKAEQDKLAGCRREAITGSRVIQKICEPVKDDSHWLSLINSPGN